MTPSHGLSTARPAFTLIELAVTLGIIVIIGAASLPSFRVAQAEYQLDNAAELVSGALIQAKSRAGHSDRQNAADQANTRAGVTVPKLYLGTMATLETTGPVSAPLSAIVIRDWIENEGDVDLNNLQLDTAPAALNTKYPRQKTYFLPERTSIDLTTAAGDPSNYGYHYLSAGNYTATVPAENNVPVVAFSASDNGRPDLNTIRHAANPDTPPLASPENEPELVFYIKRSGYLKSCRKIRVNLVDGSFSQQNVVPPVPPPVPNPCA